MPDPTLWIMPALLAVVILFSLMELRRGLRDGEMQEFMKRRDVDYQPKVFRRNKEPKSFWALFGFYVVVILISLAMIGVAIFKNSDS